MHIIFATDLHGNRESFRNLFHHAAALSADAVIFGGDLLPAPHGRQTYSAEQSNFITMVLRPLIKDFRSRSRADVIIMLGNDDSSVCTRLLLDMEHDGLVLYSHQRFIHRSGYTIYGYSYVPLTPFGIKDWDKFDTPIQIPPPTSRPPYFTADQGITLVDIERDVRPRGTIERDLHQLSGLIDPAKTILVTHSPPYSTALDVLYDGTHCGSRSVAAFIEAHHPLLTLHGHIHESPAQSGAIVDQLGTTTSINPGASIDQLHAVYLDVQNPRKTLRMIRG